MVYLLIELVLQSVTQKVGVQKFNTKPISHCWCWFNKSGNQIGVRVDGTNGFTPVNDYDNSLQTNQELRLMRNRSSQELDGKLGEFFAKGDIPGTSGTDLTHLIKSRRLSCTQMGIRKFSTK